MQRHGDGQVSEVRFLNLSHLISDETSNMQCDSQWLQKAGVQSLVEARSANSRDETTGDGTCLPCAFGDSILKRVMTKDQQAICKSSNTPRSSNR